MYTETRDTPHGRVFLCAQELCRSTGSWVASSYHNNALDTHDMIHAAPGPAVRQYLPETCYHPELLLHLRSLTHVHAASTYFELRSTDRALEEGNPCVADALQNASRFSLTHSLIHTHSSNQLL